MNIEPKPIGYQMGHYVFDNGQFTIPRSEFLLEVVSMCDLYICRAAVDSRLHYEEKLRIARVAAQRKI
jgi:hypothetical protein